MCRMCQQVFGLNFTETIYITTSFKQKSFCLRDRFTNLIKAHTVRIVSNINNILKLTYTNKCSGNMFHTS